MYDRADLKPLIISAAIFLVSCLMGVLAARENPEVGTTLLTLFKDTVGTGMTDRPPLELAGILFINNLGACVLLFIGGAAFGVLTVFILSVNGIVIGAILETARTMKGMTFVLAAIVPHGIFEIPAFILAGMLGFLLTRDLFREMTSGVDAAAAALSPARIFIVLVIPLVACAALIEAFITPEIIRLVVSS